METRKIKSKKEIRQLNNELYKELSDKNKAQNPFKTLLRLMSFIKYEKFLFVIGLTISIITTVLTLISTLILKPIIDNIAAGNLDSFADEVFIYAIISVASVILGFIGASTLAVMSQKIIAQVRYELFEHMEGLSIEYFDRNQSGDIMSVYSNDVELLSTALDQSVVKIFIAALQIIITFGILFYLNWILALVILVLLALYSIVVLFFGNKAEKHSQIKQNRLGKLNAYSEELITSMQTVKIYE